MKKQVPNLFIIGAPKTGTTALANNLAQHSEIYISKYKEPRFFDAHTFFDFEEDYPIKTLDEYLKLFNTKESKNKKYLLDSSVFNMYSEKSIKNILEISPDAKFIVLMRDPVESSVSMHKQRLKYPPGGMRELSINFLECWKMLEKRKEDQCYPKNCRNKFLFRYDLLYSYENYIPMLKENIKEENLFIRFYDEYRRDTNLFFDSIFKFLDIGKEEIKNEQMNKSYILNESKVLILLNYFLKKSLNFRKRFGLSGNKRLNKVRDFIYSFYVIKSKEKNSDLSEVKSFFKNTYEYMDQIRLENEKKNIQ